MNPLFKKAIPLLKKIERAGYEAYFVGGCVRDYILGRDISDIDIATSAFPTEIKDIFPKTIDVGIQHGTVIVLWEEETYELTTFRTDGDYQDYRRPADVTFIRNLNEDLQRRDFTMNSIAMDKDGNIIDPFGGQLAIINKKIVTVGSADARFREDALRMMRAIRFVSQLSFSVEYQTFAALRKNGILLKNISIERITVEFEKLLNGINRKQALHLLLESELNLYLPGLENGKEIFLLLISLEIDQLSTEEIWSLLLYLMKKHHDDAGVFLRRWKMSSKKIKEISSILFWLHHRRHLHWDTESLYKAKLKMVIHTERIFNVLNKQSISKSLSELESQYSKLPIKDRKEVAVGGSDIMEWEKRASGPWLKEKLENIEKALLYGKVLNNRDNIREWLQKCNQN